MLKIGHRGAAGHAPENTLASLGKGIDLGVDAVEFDVQRTGDDALVLFHDRRVDRVTNGQGVIGELKLSELRKFDAGHGQHIPLLEEALKAINGRVGAMIEIKIEGIATQVCRVVESVRFSGPTIYASFFHKELVEVRRVLQSAQTLALFEGVPVNPMPLITDSQATHAGIALDCLTQAFVNILQSQKIKVFVYTVDDPIDIQWVKSLGVDGIISNFPERL